MEMRATSAKPARIDDDDPTHPRQHANCIQGGQEQDHAARVRQWEEDKARLKNKMEQQHQRQQEELKRHQESASAHVKQLHEEYRRQIHLRNLRLDEANRQAEQQNARIAKLAEEKTEAEDQVKQQTARNAKLVEEKAEAKNQVKKQTARIAKLVEENATEFDKVEQQAARIDKLAEENSRLRRQRPQRSWVTETAFVSSQTLFGKKVAEASGGAPAPAGEAPAQLHKKHQATATDVKTSEPRRGDQLHGGARANCKQVHDAGTDQEPSQAQKQVAVIRTLAQENTNLRTEIARVTMEKNRLVKSVSEKTREYENAEHMRIVELTKTRTMQQKLDMSTKLRQEKEACIQQMKANNQRMTTEQAGRTKQLEKERAKQGDRIKQLQKECANKGNRIKQLETEGTKQGNRIKQLEIEGTKQGKRIKQLEEENAKQGDRVKQLEEENARLAAEVAKNSAAAVSAGGPAGGRSATTSGRATSLLGGGGLVKNHGEIKADDLFPILDDFKCPIMHELMEDPVCTNDGHTYERSAIAEWFRTGNKTSPITGKTLKFTTLRTNHALRKAIAAYLAERVAATADIQRERAALEEEAERAALTKDSYKESARFLALQGRAVGAEAAELRDAEDARVILGLFREDSSMRGSSGRKIKNATRGSALIAVAPSVFSKEKLSTQQEKDAEADGPQISTAAYDLRLALFRVFAERNTDVVPMNLLQDRIRAETTISNSRLGKSLSELAQQKEILIENGFVHLDPERTRFVVAEVDDDDDEEVPVDKIEKRPVLLSGAGAASRNISNKRRRMNISMDDEQDGHETSCWRAAKRVFLDPMRKRESDAISLSSSASARSRSFDAAELSSSGEVDEGKAEEEKREQELDQASLTAFKRTVFRLFTELKRYDVPLSELKKKVRSETDIDDRTTVACLVRMVEQRKIIIEADMVYLTA
ncbi:unnamed protein product [Amoebophrya sp. A120]|nr:unnamed protein product [Amoebophrya sp. A120]|eukprot:GSA120T00011989001.1